MKNRSVKLLAALFLSFSMLLSATVSGSALGVGTKVNTSAISYAYSQIGSISASMEEATWNNDTVISETIPLYDLDDNINGYIFNLTTNGESSGYIQLAKTDDSNYMTIAYAFHEHHHISLMHILKRLKTVPLQQMQNWASKAR